jgi:hypothetical protein
MLRAAFAAGIAACLLTASSRLDAQSSFPAAWAGHWEGRLATFSPPDSVRNAVPLSLVIARRSDSTWTWRTVFNADTVRGLRDYRLLVRDAAKGHYATDEGNGLVLESTLVAGALVSVFQVGTRVLESRYTLEGDSLVHDIVWWDAAAQGAQRGSGANAEAGATVRSFRVEGRQRAVLRRVSAAR